MTGQKDEFQPRELGTVKMFVCGPTVYDWTHVGHARTYLAYDLLARYLLSQGYHLKFIVNITDLDDKVFDRADAEGVDYRHLTDKYTHAFIEDLRSLRINSVSAFIRASDYLTEIERQVQMLIEKGHAYRADSGDIYFDTSTFPRYGRLANLTPAEIKLRRIDPDPHKRSQSDFILWRSWTQKGSPPSFPSGFGQGRPGWHIEDTAISIPTLGPEYDIHGGAVELIFPHHEAEIAQAESITGQTPFVKYWVHTGLLLIDGEKMSKSLGNIITLRDMLNRCHADTLRLYLLSKHYRKVFNFKMDDIPIFEEQAALIHGAVNRLKQQLNKPRRNVNAGSTGLNPRYKKPVDRFFQALNDDLNTPKAINSLISLLTTIDKDGEAAADPQLLITILRMLSILGLE
ncbi:MAG: cysteine--tRNA ligase [Thaumarchaeota archaeon]|nr:cysteine--tRNA ligase [Nitrososphaerota archaeon]MCL5318032.1 cysteine--tRNA ligase [Nitrososphaerota archaeon]